ncbi:unnamed protein product [Cylicocyclus nassatus]|uniref:Cation/H+ exchanger transmembrane domain-containing protein n=1 Tax=Cylicocyclus nassatus TaxID=53992 RepID=A0AA36H3Y6_CYLNA|nr:unnamed protein product [Cylicocyclus nassatus]
MVAKGKQALGTTIMNSSLRNIKFVRVLIDVLRNNHINFLITSFFILLFTYLTVLAAFGRDFLHPFTIPDYVLQLKNTSFSPIVDSTSLITSAFSLFFLLVFSLCVGKIFYYLSLPPLFGSLLVGLLVKNIVVLNEIFYIHPRWEWVIRTLALTIILIRCGIGLNWDYLKEAMGATLGLGLMTAAIESAAIILAAIFIFKWSVPMAFITGFVMAAVSPAVTVPIMLDLQSQGLGTRKGIPTLALGSAALDNVFCITAFSVASAIIFSTAPLAQVIVANVAEIIIGIFIGICAGWLLWWFPISYVENASVCRTLLLASICSAAVLGGQVLGFQSAGLIIAVLTSFVAGIRWKIDNDDKIRFEEKAFALLWKLFFMPLLLSLIGMKLDFSTMNWTIVLTGCALIGIGVVFRFLSGIIFSSCSGFSMREQLVTALSLLPKASVQAALAPGIYSLVADTPHLQDEAHMAVTACVLAILLTAPLGQYLLLKASPILLKNSRVVGIAKSSLEDMEFGGKPGRNNVIRTNGNTTMSYTSTARIEEDVRF